MCHFISILCLYIFLITLSHLTQRLNMSMNTPNEIKKYQKRINSLLDRAVPPSNNNARLNDAMRYAVMSGGKRIRPLLIYSSGLCFDIQLNKLDIPAVSIELLHAFSLVHDDLPSMDDDDLRRGLPTTHKKFSEATAILAADALQTLSFELIANSESLDDYEKIKLVSLIAKACGSSGMTGGQSIDLASEGKTLSKSELHEMHAMKTGALIHASIMAPFCMMNNPNQDIQTMMSEFAWTLGLAFQIRDDLLDIEQPSEVIGKTANSDIKNNKATWPAIFGVKESHSYCDKLLKKCIQHLEYFDHKADTLRWLTNYLINRKH